MRIFYRIRAIKYYLENDIQTCEIFRCSERSLKRWIEELEEKKRLNRKSISYKITKNQIKYDKTKNKRKTNK